MSWPLVKLSDVAFFQEGPGVRKWQFRNEGIKLINVKNIVDEVLVTENSDKYLDPDEVEKKYSHFLTKVGDLVMASSGATWGKLAWVEEKHLPLCMNTSMIRFQSLDSNKLDIRYLFYYLKTVEFRRDMEKLVTGSAQPNFGSTHLKQISLPLPPLEEQKRIAAILDKADAIRHKRKQAIELADEFLRSVFLDMFGDPVTNPKGFPVKVLSELYIDPKNGTKCGPFGSALKKEEFVDKGIPVWNMDNISLSGNFKDEPKLWVTEEKFNEINAYSVIDGDVIISRAGTVGKMGVVRSKYSSSLISTNLIRVRFSDDLLPEYFVSLMTYCKGRVGRLKTGPDGSFTHMNTGILDKLELPYPPVELQRKFLKLLADTEKNLDKMSPRQLSLLFNALSQKAFSGQL